MILFVWDFHGVLEKDNEKAVLIITNEVLSRFGYKERLTEEKNDEYLGLKWYQYFENIIPGLQKERYLELQEACFKFDENDDRKTIAENIKPNDYAKEVLQKIQESGNQQLVISNTKQDAIIWYVNAVGIKEYFSENNIIGVNAHQTHNTKFDALTEYISDKNFEKIIAIGDSESDLELGKKFGAITYYYRRKSRKQLESKIADYTINDLREVLKELK